jgi:pyridoxine kinase
MKLSSRPILTLQDISCFGQCSLTVALPILSACGLETVILPSAVLSTHTGGFSGWTFRDLTDDIPRIVAHWKKEGIRFRAFYTGYLGSARQIDMALGIASEMLEDGAPLVVDPAMADNGALYGGFDAAFVREMARLAAKADYLLPNVTEACLLTGTDYRAPGEYDQAWIDSLLAKLAALGAKKVVLKGVCLEEGFIRVLVHDAAGGGTGTYRHERLPASSHGTGDVFASAFSGALLRGRTPLESVKIAADYVVACIRATMGDDGHAYGVKFEECLPQLVFAVR